VSRLAVLDAQTAPCSAVWTVWESLACHYAIERAFEMSLKLIDTAQLGRRRVQPWKYVPHRMGYRARGPMHEAFLSVSRGYVPRRKGDFDQTPSRIAVVGKNNAVLTPCAVDEDERVMVITLPFGPYGLIGGEGCSYFWKIITRVQRGYTSRGTPPAGHVIAALKDLDGFVFVEAIGQVIIYKWDGCETVSREECEKRRADANERIAAAELPAIESERVRIKRKCEALAPLAREFGVAFKLMRDGVIVEGDGLAAGSMPYTDDTLRQLEALVVALLSPTQQ
jgi:hypothetical protein